MLGQTLKVGQVLHRAFHLLKRLSAVRNDVRTFCEILRTDAGEKTRGAVGRQHMAGSCHVIADGCWRKIADEYIVANKIDETAEYQKQLSQAINNLHREILNNAINVPITEAEVRSSYEEWNSGRSFEEDREMIEKVLKKQKFRPYFDEKIEQLKQEYDVKINEDFVK